MTARRYNIDIIVPLCMCYLIDHKLIVVVCMCVLQAIKMVRVPKLKPFIVYFQPPSPDVMRRDWIPAQLIKVESKFAAIVYYTGYTSNH